MFLEVPQWSIFGAHSMYRSVPYSANYTYAYNYRPIVISTHEAITHS